MSAPICRTLALRWQWISRSRTPTTMTLLGPLCMTDMAVAADQVIFSLLEVKVDWLIGHLVGKSPTTIRWANIRCGLSHRCRSIKASLAPKTRSRCWL
jgi:hypothetical protein